MIPFESGISEEDMVQADNVCAVYQKITLQLIVDCPILMATGLYGYLKMATKLTGENRIFLICNVLVFLNVSPKNGQALHSVCYFRILRYFMSFTVCNFSRGM